MNTSQLFPRFNAVLVVTITAAAIVLFIGKIASADQVLAMGASMIDYSEVVTASALDFNISVEKTHASVATKK